MLPRFKILNEKRVHKYTIPSSKKRQLFDFYLLSALQSLLPLPSVGYRDLDPDLELNITEGVNTLFPALRRDLLEAVFYAINAELRHTYQHRRINQELVDTTFTDKEKAAYEYLKEYRDAHLRGSSNKAPDAPSSGDRPPESEKVDSQYARNVMYKGAMYAIKKSGMTLSEWVTMCGKFFKDGAWFGGYGGKAWYDICEGWLMLNNATSISGNMGVMSMLQKGAKKPEMQIPMGVAIDYIYDLQHNTGSVLNKMKAYYDDGGYEWLKESLDFKRYLKSLYELLPNVSPSLKQAALPVIKNKLGDTLDAFKKMSIDAAYQSNQDTIQQDTTQQDGDFKFVGLYRTKSFNIHDTYTGSMPTPKYSSFYKNNNTTTKIQTFESQITILSAKHNDTYKTLNKVTGHVEPHTIFCVASNFYPVGVEYIQDASTVYEVVSIDESTGKIHVIGYRADKTYPPSILSLNDVPLAFFNDTTAFKYIPWLQEKVYQRRDRADADVEDKSGANINSDLDYTDNMIGSMSSGT
jgi:hypothetical protein